MISKVVPSGAQLRQFRQTAPPFMEHLPGDRVDYRERHRILAVGEQALVSSMTPETGVFAPGAPIVEEGQQPTKLYRIVSGWVVCRKTLLDGRRQVASILIPGDTIGAKGLLTRSASDLIEAHQATCLQSISHARVLSLAAEDFNVAVWLLWHTSREHLRSDKWLTLLCQGNAIERIAITLLDIYCRLSRAGLVGDGSVRLPISQGIIGEHVGLTLPYVCRTLGILRKRGGVDIRYGEIEIVDPDALRASAGDLADFWEQ